MLPVFIVTGWSPVAGDVAYVEAVDHHHARALLDHELRGREFECIDDAATWSVIEMSRPLLVVVFRD